jgi:VanZ like protein/concanavalin A-like lectin/glucanase superfamily protein
MLLRAICGLTLFGILVAGLWPFHAPINQVSWLGQENGVRFGKHGSIVSANPFKARATQEGNACSVEIWLKPSRIDSGGMILAFYRPETRFVPFAVRQWGTGLALEPEGSRRHFFPEKGEIYIGDVFASLKPVFVTITSGRVGTDIYVDGKLVKRVPSFIVSNQDLTGEFVVGGAPSFTYNWPGQVKGLAMYDRELSAAEASQGFVDWTTGSKPDSAKSAGLVARYLFDERRGNMVHNQVDSATNLLIPEHFFVLHEQFLGKPWDEFRPGWRYWKDIGVNVVGFIPLGFFFYAYFSQLRKTKHSVAVTIAFGFAVSLTIEVLQAFLPTRDSGMTDLITNTLGTGLGVMAFRHKALPALVAVLRGV